MNRSTIDLCVGIFVVAGIAGLLFLALKVGNLTSFSTSEAYQVQAKFANIGGLKVRAPIKSAGVAVKELKREAGVHEQPDVDSADAVPDRYKLLAVQAWTAEKISTGTLAKLLHCSMTEAREIAYQCAEVDDDVDGVPERFSVNLTDSLLTAR